MTSPFLKESPDAMEFLRVHDPILHRSIAQYERARPDERNHGGTILIDGEEVAQTLCCCHCNKHFLNVRIPGKARGWCMNCEKPVCPDVACDECVPFMQKIENMEQGRPIGFKPTWAHVTVDPPKGAE